MYPDPCVIFSLGSSFICDFSNDTIEGLMLIGIETNRDQICDFKNGIRIQIICDFHRDMDPDSALMLMGIEIHLLLKLVTVCPISLFLFYTVTCSVNTSWRKHRIPINFD